MNPLSVLAVVGAAGLVYWAVIFGPLYLDNLDVKGAAEVGFTGVLGGADQMRTLTLQRINSATADSRPIGHHFEENENGEMVEKPGLGLTDENVTVDYDEARRFARITISYSRTVRLKPTQAVRTLNFVIEKEKKF